MKWKKEKPYDGPGHKGCLNCGPLERILPLKAHLAVGFGMMAVTKNGKIVWEEKPNAEWEDAPTLRKFENLAAKDPDNNWRVEKDAPMYSAVWQRQGKAKWVLIKRGNGFA